MQLNNYILSLLNRSGSLLEPELLRDCMDNLGVSREAVFAALKELRETENVYSIPGLGYTHWGIDKEEEEEEV